ncbi:MAG: c-type cytochrome [Chitinophagales bacterium]
MNKQIEYITTAHLILFSIAAGYFFISKISSAPTGSETVSNNVVVIEPVLSATAAMGKTLFISKCAACHGVNREINGPALADFENRGPWSDREQLYKWIRNPEKFIVNDPYTQGLKKKFNFTMNPFPELTDEQIDGIVDYINVVDNKK